MNNEEQDENVRALSEAADAAIAAVEGVSVLVVVGDAKSGVACVALRTRGARQSFTARMGAVGLLSVVANPEGDTPDRDTLAAMHALLEAAGSHSMVSLALCEDVDG